MPRDSFTKLADAHMHHVWPILAVADVRTSASWYESLLATGSHSDDDNREFSQIFTEEGEVLLCLHRWVSPDPQVQHLSAALSNPGRGPTGHGLLLWFIVEDFEEAWRRAQALHAQVIERPSIHAGTGLRAFVVRDPDGYHVAVNESPTPSG
jgi:hypothetical protein